MNKVLADLCDFNSLEPTHKVPQKQALEWTGKYSFESLSLTNPDSLECAYEFHQKRFSKYGVSPLKIGHRVFEHPEIGNLDFTTNTKFNIDKTKPNGPDLGERSKFFKKRSLEIFNEFYDSSPSPNHLIHVTCTGYVSPSAPQILVSNKNWKTEVTHAYHMGCYASMPAVRMAQGFIANAQSHEQTNFSVDVVHTEMCALHFNPQQINPEQIIVQSLFSDGSVKYKLQLPNTAKRGFHLLHVEEKIIPNTYDLMTWTPQAWGFEMTLSREVPMILKNNIRDFMIQMMKNSNMNLAEFLQTAIFAIHPGGPRIIEVVREELELRDNQVGESFQVLFERGNMSSATLPFVWNKIMLNSYPSGTPVVSLAFGPGLSVFGGIFKVI